MSEQPPDRDAADDVDELYRRASTSDNSRPTEAVRKAVLAHAERVAAEGRARAKQCDAARIQHGGGLRFSELLRPLRWPD